MALRAFGFSLAYILVMLPAIAADAEPAEKAYAATARMGVSVPGVATPEEQMLQAETAANVKFYLDGDDLRIELSRMDEPPLIRIAQEKEHKLWIFTKGEAQARLFPRTEKTTDLVDALAHFQLAKKSLVGPDVVDGFPCVKYKVVMKERPAFIWLDPKTGMPLKIGDGKYFVLVFNSFKFEPQDKTLFAAPGA